MLSIEGIHVSIQSAAVLRGLSMTIPDRTMVGLVGRNGAGKTTLMRSLMGHLRPSQGRMLFNGCDLSTLASHERARLGIGYMQEDRGLVPELTVEENILLPVWASRTLSASERLAFVYGILPEIKEMRHRRALLLSGGQQKLVALGRALAVGTRLLLLDEPFEGVAPALSKRLAEVILKLKASDLSIFISQSDLNHSRRIVDLEYTIERGANIGSVQP
ncbi:MULTISPECIES: ATP-binding cassette domain-containing protein [Cupriavidus]|uniref:Branched-chain amino acid transport system ATP-binding protein n=1 Tax=Cupriavidus alkaliphilus TaxID=942866 RepID=A0A7W4YSI5_9BURK|nr:MULTISPECIES: ATP-binding cassette domain-containing protein [Cupriavidus]MBB3009855.1 branched-chain amino acid transport system ATP-binding protein [Cupriavidus alkaliphilus]TDF62604.1 ATP-binding cassette domain-containing protein [Cupriavidus sp. L7L]